MRTLADSLRSLTPATQGPEGGRRTVAILRARHGCPEAEDVESAARQAPGAACDLRTAGAGLPDLQAAEAGASRVPELQDVQGPRGGAASVPGTVDTPVVTRVAVDAVGGDRGPDVIVQGALAAASPDIEPVLYGPPDLDPHDLRHVATTQAIEMDESPVDAVRAKPDASLVRAVRAVADGEAEAVVSAGSTGATLTASLLHIRRLPGVHRPAIAVVIPARVKPTVLIDSGANADARAEHLLQFAHMGAVFAEEILGVEHPEVRLLSIGEEDEKGNQLTLDAHELLRSSDLRFAGNVESRRLLEGDTDVVVTDGFTGNVALKAIEGTIRSLLDSMRGELESSFRGKLGGLLIRPGARRVRHRLDPETYGGAYLLGLRGLVVIAHGSSSSVAIANAIRLAARGVEHRVVEHLEAQLPERVAAPRS
jgi:phosphate acyltransferase